MMTDKDKEVMAVVAAGALLIICGLVAGWVFGVIINFLFELVR
jgi:hypothetical protein